MPFLACSSTKRSAIAHRSSKELHWICYSWLYYLEFCRNLIYSIHLLDVPFYLKVLQGQFSGFGLWNNGVKLNLVVNLDELTKKIIYWKYLIGLILWIFPVEDLLLFLWSLRLHNSQILSIIKSSPCLARFSFGCLKCWFFLQFVVNCHHSGEYEEVLPRY